MKYGFRYNPWYTDRTIKGISLLNPNCDYRLGFKPSVDIYIYIYIYILVINTGDILKHRIYKVEFLTSQIED